MILLQYRRELATLSRAGYIIPATEWGELRYQFYRRKGHSPEDARAYAVAWEDNMDDQRERRLAHETGAR